MVADVALTGLSRDAWHRFGKGDMERQVAICPLAGTNLFQIQAPIPAEGEIDLSVAGLNAMLADRVGGREVQVRSVSWASAYAMNARLAARYRDRHVLLIGDAAHIHPPTGGQGLNTSVQDAYNLGWKLAAVLGGASETLLESYEQERRPVAEEILGLSTRLLDAMKQGEMRRGRDVHQLDIGYPGSPLACEARERNGPVLAGDRAPDAPLRGAAGCLRRLFELFAGPHWTLLGIEAEGDPVSARPGLRIHHVGEDRELVDEAGHLQNAYGLTPGDWVLVRPDGYIGAIVASERIDALAAYLDRVGLAGEDHAHG